MISGEDSPGVTTRSRLQAAGADLDRVHHVEMRRQGEKSWITIPSDLPEIESLIHTKGVELVVVDPINAFFTDGFDPNRDASVRQALGRLSSMAEGTGAAIVLVMHLNKGMHGGGGLYRVLGSIGYVAQARSVLALAPDPDDPAGERGSRRVLAHVKCNLSPLAPSLTYEIVSTSLPGGIETSRIVELGESPYSARDLLEASRTRPRSADKLGAACALLERELADGDWHPAKPIRERAQAPPVSGATLNRAKGELGVEGRIVRGFPATHEWRLPAQPGQNVVPMFPPRPGWSDEGAEQSRPSTGAGVPPSDPDQPSDKS